MKRTLMMLVAMLATVASIQAADVKVNLQNRGPNQQMTSAQNVKYSISNAEGEIVAEGEGSEINLDLPEGNYEITVEQTGPNGQVRYGAQQMKVTPEGANVSFEITPNGLQPVNPNAPAVRSTIPRQPRVARPNVNGSTAPGVNGLPGAAGVGNMGGMAGAAGAAGGMAGAMGGSLGMLGTIGAMVATTVAVTADDEPESVSGVQR